MASFDHAVWSAFYQPIKKYDFSKKSYCNIVAFEKNIFTFVTLLQQCLNIMPR